MLTPEYTLVLHGGAGNSYTQAGRAAVDRALATGAELLGMGSTALDAVTACVVMLEDDPSLYAGRGSEPNSDGNVEMDAGIMNGIDLSAGSVASVSSIRNPIRAARAVMESSPHVFLVGAGAETFARTNNLRFEDPAYFHSGLQAIKPEHGTVGAVARDSYGNLAAATSTGGLDGKHPGRVGDTPIVGAGVYADNRTCAVSATGIGEDCIRTVLARRVAELIEHQGLSAQGAATAAIQYLVERIDGHAGLIVVDSNGGYGTAHSTPAMLSGVATSGG
jgi:L-asparaginase / beta-aspartyl-peptidase